MFLLDANVLIYAFRRDLPEHSCVKEWLETKLAGTEQLGLFSITELAFLRITTNPRVFTEPSPVEEGIRFLDFLRSSSVVVELHPGPEHRTLFLRLAREHRLVANDLSDAFIAAGAMENGATLASADRGFARFRGLRWIDPIQEIGEK